MVAMTAGSNANRDASPRASGPAGPQFEAKVATHYALAVLARTEAFGLPGAIVERIEFQRGAQGHPLDDIVIKGRAHLGEERCLEIQAKRSMAFTEGDENFSKVVAGIVASYKGEQARQFAVAIERTSRSIENGVHEVLELARATTTVESFLGLLDTPGRANANMRRFVDAFRKHLNDNAIADDKILFQLLRRFVVLVFDYARPHSIAEHHDRMRARQLASASQGQDPYDTLFGVVLGFDAIGGEADRLHLIQALREKGIEIAASKALAKARSRIEEMSRFALSDINTDVAGHELVRAARRQELEACLDEAEVGQGIVEISGPGGAGKSALLKAMAETRGLACRIVVLAPDRTPRGGWAALRSDFDVDASAKEFLEDLSCDGGGLICIDGLDRFRDGRERKTVLDVMRSALTVKGMTVLFTARTGWQEAAELWLDDDLVDALRSRKSLVVEGLNDEEATALTKASPSLAPLLRSDHPARALARNPFILRRLLQTRLDTKKVLSEASLARDWWTSGAHGIDLAEGVQRARRRVLVRICESLSAGNALADVSGQDAHAVAALLRSEVLVEIGATDQVKFKHDLFIDWALACFLSENSSRIVSLDVEAPVPFWLNRGFELSCCLLAEAEDPGAWPGILETLEEANAHSSWTGVALLALVHSEVSERLLARFGPNLLQEEGERAATLIRRATAAHGQSADPIFKELFPQGTPIPEGLVLPEGPVWLRLIVWCASRFDTLPSQALSAAIDLFEKWMALAVLIEDGITPILLERFADLLVARTEDRDRPLPKPGGPLPKIRYPVSGHDLETARLQLAVHARRAPKAAARYLVAVSESSRAADELYRILQFPGTLPAAAPSEFCAAFRSAVRRDKEDISELGGTERIGSVFSRLEGPFVLDRSGVEVFTALLNADSEQGLRLIRELVEEAEKAVGPETGNAFEVVLAGRTRRISPTFSYGWSRGHSPSTLLSKALVALEHWAHQQVDSPELLDEVVRRISGPKPISGAILLVIVDLVLSHSTLNGKLLTDLVSSPETLALDAIRAQHDFAESVTGGALSIRSIRGNRSDQAVVKELSERPSRRLALHDVISQLVFYIQDEETTELRNRLSSAIERVGSWTADRVDLASPVFMASHALRLATRDNYEEVTEVDPEGGERRGWRFRWPEGQWRWLQAQSAKATAEHNSFNKSLAVRMAMDAENRSVNVSVADAEAVLVETEGASPDDRDERHDSTDPWLNRVAAGAFLARFGDTPTIETHRAGLVRMFAQALQEKESTWPNLRYDVMYDPRALAIAGHLYLVISSEALRGIRDLFVAIGSFPASAAAVFWRHRQAARQLGQTALQSAIRIGLQACIFPRRANSREEEDAFNERQSRSEQCRSERLGAELSWLCGDGKLPRWPYPPPRRSRRSRRGITLPGNLARTSKARSRPVWPDFYFDNRTAAVWLQTLSQLGDDGPAAIAALLTDNRDWLLEVNAPGEDDEDDTDLERTWTRGLLECAARYAKCWSPDEIQLLVFDLLEAFSEEAFIDAGAAFLLQSDLAHIEGDATDTAHLVSIRERIWTRLKGTKRWRQHLWSSRSGMEIHLSELISAFFFKYSHGFGSQTAYTGGLTDDQLIPFLPILTEITVAASPCATISPLFLDVLEVVDRHVGEPFLVEVALHWATDADVHFWSELGIGRRVCGLARKFHRAYRNRPLSGA